MVYQKYGFIFRKIRQQKKLSMSIFPKVGISKPTLSKFERGKTMMSFESVVCGLQEMGVTLEEYENFLNDYSLGEEDTLWEEIESSALSENVEELKYLYNYTKDAGFPYLSLSAKACYLPLSSQETDEITDYLYEIEIWGMSELRLFYFTIDELNVRDTFYILRKFFPKGHDFFHSKKYQTRFVRLCCRAVVRLSKLGYQKEGELLLEQLEIHGLLTTMFQRNLKNLTKGYWEFCFSDAVKGEEQILESLEILKKVSSSEEFFYYKKRYKLRSYP